MAAVAAVASGAASADKRAFLIWLNMRPPERI
jgi:hypothetical protein